MEYVGRSFGRERKSVGFLLKVRFDGATEIIVMWAPQRWILTEYSVRLSQKSILKTVNLWRVLK